MTANDSTISYGIRRLILINSGMYDYSVFPIDAPLSVCGQNNSGKSTAINALQFLFLADMRDMDFGKHENLQTRKFYFPGPASYVLAEISLEHGTFVIGAAGSGAASQHLIQHFAYTGAFDPAAFHTGEVALGLEEMMRGLQRQGIECFKLHPQELRNMLLGVPGDHRLDLTLVPLRAHQERTISAWISIFKNLLHMRNVNSQDLKRLLLHIFDIRLVASDIDFAHEYQRVNQEVTRLEEELDLLRRMRPHVKRITDSQERRQELRGRLAAAYPLIQRQLEDWHEKARVADAREGDRLEAIEPERQTLGADEKEARERLEQAAGELAKADKWLQDLQQADESFQLVADLESLDTELTQLRERRDEIVKSIGAAEDADPDRIEKEIRRVQARAQQLERTLANWDHNLWGLLSTHFDTENLQALFALLNRDLLHLPVDTAGGIAVEAEQELLRSVKSALARIQDGIYHGQGVRVPLAELTDEDARYATSPDRLRSEKEALDKTLERLNRQLKTAREMARLSAEARRLENSIEEKRRFREAFVKYLDMCSQREEMTARRQELEQARTESNQDLTGIRDKERALDQEIEALKANRLARDKQRRDLERLQQQIVPLPPSEPAGISTVIEQPDSLQELMEEYVFDLRDKNDADRQIQNELEAIEGLGGGSYLHEQEESSIRSLEEAVANIPQQSELLDKAKRTAVAELGNTLKGLLGNYRRLVNEVGTFNRAINRRTISNLTRLEIRLEPNQQIVSDIEEVVNSGEYRLFADENKAADAAGRLYQWVSSQGRRLNLTHLFELCFVVFSQEGREIVYRNLDQIESHGTTITIKALVNMHMMGQLIDETRVGQVRIPYYLDEAASIDPSNQDNLIDQGLRMGFVPILASVKPQPTATYCVKIGNPVGDGGLVIDEEAWVKIERKS